VYWDAHIIYVDQLCVLLDDQREWDGGVVVDGRLDGRESCVSVWRGGVLWRESMLERYYSATRPQLIHS
jgi:hypothetical protein